jgi:hypothetical protein
MQDGAGAEAGSIQTLLTLLADGEEQARQLGEMVADDPWSRAEHYRGAARRLQCTLGKAAAVARAIEAAAPGSSRGTDRSDSPRSADESSGRTTVATEVQERQSMCKRRCVARSLFFSNSKNTAYPYVRAARQMRCQTSALEKVWRVHACVLGQMA